MTAPLVVSIALTRTPDKGEVVVPSVIRPVITKFTVTLKEPVAVLPDVSVAVQLTVVVPCAKFDPDAGVQTVELTPTLSVAVAAKVTAAGGGTAGGVAGVSGGRGGGWGP